MSRHRARRRYIHHPRHPHRHNEAFGARLGVTHSSADLGGSIKYSHEDFFED